MHLLQAQHTVYVGLAYSNPLVEGLCGTGRMASNVIPGFLGVSAGVGLDEAVCDCQTRRNCEIS